ncbi:MAG TPA: TetR/AcrR family transcriptional regulator [Desulfomonilaceae bacterium]|nr:TetR/AcrR family transcriptional regulator [Desulfomonilaceae bacterium]
MLFYRITPRTLLNRAKNCYIVADRLVTTKPPVPHITMKNVESPGTELFDKLPPEKQEKVFQAAVGEFASKGYKNASMNSLVKIAGISKGSLFQYFKTKRNLFDGVMGIATHRVKLYLKRVRDDTQEMDFYDRLEHLLRSGFEFIDRHPLLARIYFHLLQSAETPSGSEEIIQLRMQGNEFLADLIREGAVRGEFRTDMDIPRLAFLINALLETLLRAYYTEFLASGLGLYRGNAAELDLWVATTLDFVRKGTENRERQ